MRCPPFIMGGGHYAYSFGHKRVAEKSRYFRGAGHGLGDCGVASKGPQLSEAKLGSEQCSPQRGE